MGEAFATLVKWLPFIVGSGFVFNVLISFFAMLIGTAGVIEPIGHLDALSPEDWGRVIDLNLKGVFYGMRAALPMIQNSGGGPILPTRSGAGDTALEG